MTPILLATLNARYSHCAFGLRYILANMGELQGITKVCEFTISQNPRDIVETILSYQPKVVGFGIYIWNVRQTQEVIAILKSLKPDLKIVLGGPEVSYETESQDICKLADLTIQGEGDLLFRDVCRRFLNDFTWPDTPWITGPLPEVTELTLPYFLYTDDDIRNRVIYVEASRGCPYKCEYCLSSLDKSVRSFNLDSFLSAMTLLIDRGARQFKFVDRTFNLSISTSSRILEFFLSRIDLGLFLHFEMVPDRLPQELRVLIERFPKGSLQFEVGIQTWNPIVSRLVSRRQDYNKIRENFAYLKSIGSVHTHADLIAGLPGETFESFADGFDSVAELGAEEIQVGILKRLRGTPIVRHDQEWQMIYQPHPPYQVLQTRTMSFNVLQDVDRFSHYWNLVANSGNFKETLDLLKELSRARLKPSLHAEFSELSTFLAKRHPQGHGIALLNLVESVWLYLTQQRNIDPNIARSCLVKDYASSNTKRDVPGFLRDEAGTRFSPGYSKETSAKSLTKQTENLPKRQKRHIESPIS